MSRREDTGEGKDHPIIVFDAECVLCSANARFVLKHDLAGRFRLATMQGNVGAALYRRFGMDPSDPVSMLVVDGDTMHRDSDAVLTICEQLGWPWSLLGTLRIIPALLRDPVYRLIARNRYRLFGRRESCWVAPPEYHGRCL